MKPSPFAHYHRCKLLSPKDHAAHPPQAPRSTQQRDALNQGWREVYWEAVQTSATNALVAPESSSSRLASDRPLPSTETVVKAAKAESSSNVSSHTSSNSAVVAWERRIKQILATTEISQVEKDQLLSMALDLLAQNLLNEEQLNLMNQALWHSSLGHIVVV